MQGPSSLNPLTNADLKRGSVIFDGQGVVQQVQAGVASQNVDFTLPDTCFLTGAVLRVANAAFGDTASAQVVSADGSTVLATFITNWNMISDQQQQFDLEVPYPAQVLAGMRIRLVYNSIGNVAPVVALNLELHKALV